MPSYKLNILFEDAEDLDTIYDAGEQVTLIKQTQPGQQLAWIAFDPFKNNLVEWSDNYAIYASKSKVESGATVTRLADTIATPGKRYLFEGGALHSGKKDSSLKAGEYQVYNAYPGARYLTFGMAQDVQVNGTPYPNNPINAVTVPAKQTVNFIPYEKIMVCLRNSMRNSLVFSEVTSEDLVLTYGGGATEHTIHYESGNGRFKLVS